jgi:Protein of unknown function (DUF1194)
MRQALVAVSGLISLGALASGSAGAAVADNVVDLQLVLAVDVSRSMDSNEQRIQRDGYVDAFKSPEVQQAINSGPYGRIAVTYIEWSSSTFQRVLVPWRIIASNQDAIAFADELAKAPIETNSRTSISSGLSFAATRFSRSGLVSDRRTIDVSGDGPNNEPPSLPPVRDRVVAQGININGLPILLDPSQTFGAFGQVSLQDYYQDCVIGGPGSFVIPITSLGDFAPAIRRKLVLEIAEAAQRGGVIPVDDPQPSARPKIDCLLAERLSGGGGVP